MAVDVPLIDNLWGHGDRQNAYNDSRSLRVSSRKHRKIYVFDEDLITEFLYLV